jgi:hypothetical protein
MIANLRKEVARTLTQRGYVQHERTLRQRIDEDRSWIVDTGPLDSRRTDIAPFVGIRHQLLEKLTSELLAVPPDESNATAGANVGYILGLGYKIYASPTPVAEVLKVIDAAIQRLEPHAAFVDLPRIWSTTAVYDPGWRYRDIAFKLLVGQRQDIDAALTAARAEFCEYEDEVCSQFREFERNVRMRM